MRFISSTVICALLVITPMVSANENSRVTPIVKVVTEERSSIWKAN